MRLSRALRVVLATLMAVMLLGGSASGISMIIPTVTWTPADLSAGAAVDEDSVGFDGKLVAWEQGDGIRVRNLATGATRSIPDLGGTQADPDVSGDRVAYMDNTSGSWAIRLYYWSTDNTTEVRNSADDEMFPRIDGNFVIWRNNTDDSVESRDYDMGGHTYRLESSGWNLYDVDNGRLVVGDTGSATVWVKDLRPMSDWYGNHSFGQTVQDLELHGDRLVVEVFDGVGDSDVLAYDFASGVQSDVAVDPVVDEQAPSVFHYTSAFMESGVADYDIGYQWIGFWLIQTPSFGHPTEDDRYAALYGRRIAYQHDDGVDNDVALATSDTKLQTRTSGTNRYGTAAAISAAYFSDAQHVVLCNGLNFPDALSAAPLAKALKAPLLLTAPGSLSPETLTEITRLGPTKVWIIGGSDVVSNAIYTQLDATYDVERIAGDDRYATSAAIARKLEQVLGPDAVSRGFFARGDAFPDALAVGPVAAAANGPVMLVKPTSVPAAIASAVNDMDITIGYVIGGPDVVSPGVDTALRALITANGAVGTITERWSGDNRYATAAAVAEKGLGNRWIDLDTVGFAIGTNFPDALGGGAALGHYGSALLLTSGTGLSAATASFLDTHAYEVGRIDCFGGADVLTAPVFNAILAKVR